ncbi:hypothetical protein JYU29_14770 [Tianweitania sp. BSSL-BM11]|uniref:Uncharacterized protein n=1 Tax=Tianweitania aestuarii TaxID=2814886 RepID=A0ABS5S076_9HYPH|nr:hypothetical protein [Tianweitania aestuarii]MBS9721952.1 hypothetical protein [Tianweitania aestuarii]
MNLLRATLVVAVTLLANQSLAQDADTEDRLGVPGPIQFQNTAFALAWSSKPTNNTYKQEYVPAGQSVESFEDMFLVEAVTGSLTPAEAATAQIDFLKQRKATDPVVNYAILHNEKTGNIVLDFVLSDLQADPVIVEWNAYRYAPLKNDGGVALYGMSRRAYGEADAKAMLRGLKAIRDADLEPLALFDVPVISVED